MSKSNVRGNPALRWPIGAKLIILSAFVISSLFAPLAHAQEEPAKRVLVLNSYHNGFDQTDNIVMGIKDVLNPKENNIELVIEYMDTKAIEYNTQYKETLFDLYRYKYGNQTFDLVISSDDNAFNFLLEYHKDLFPRVPIVFCGVNNLNAPDLVDPEVFTGVIEQQSLRETIDLALGLHPRTRQIVFVVDNTPTGVYLWDQIQYLGKYYKDIRMTRIDDSLSMEQIEDKVSKLSDDAIVLYGPLHRDKSARYYSFEESASRISQASARPMYGYSVQVLPYGIVGGKLFGGFYHGQVAAKVAQRILMGEKVRDIPVLTEPQTQYMFDYEQMERWGIKVSDLPEGSIVVNKPHSFYEENKELIWGIIAVMTLQTLTIIGLLVNVSRRKRAEGALKEYSERLEEMVKERTRELCEAQEQLVRREKLAALGQLAGGMGHELRNPLGVISNAIYFLQMTLPDAGETTSEYLSIISSEVCTAEKIVSDLLDYSRTRLPEREEIAVSELVAQVLAKRSPPEGVEVATQIPADLPPVYVDSRQIGQVLVNLVTNAYQAMPEGGRLIIAATVSGDQSLISNLQSLISISITDTGCGISEEHKAKLFEPLFTTKARGIGLGLATARSLVEANGGMIEVENKMGKGSTFTVRLPTGEREVEGERKQR